jgi:hypothetical protein
VLRVKAKIPLMLSAAIALDGREKLEVDGRTPDQEKHLMASNEKD